MLLSCRNDASHDCSAGDDLDLWGTSDTLNQVLNATRAPASGKPGVLQFLRQSGTCVSSKGGLLRMFSGQQVPERCDFLFLASLFILPLV